MREKIFKYIILCLLIVCVFMNLCIAFESDNILRELTSKQKEADFKYLTKLVRDVYLYNDYNVKIKRLENIVNLENQYIERAVNSKSNEEFFEIFYEYIERLHQTGHAYFASATDFNHLSKSWQQFYQFYYNFKEPSYYYSDYWRTIERNLISNWYAYSNLDSEYKNGKYYVARDCYLDLNHQILIPAGSQILRMNGLTPDQYVKTVQNKIWLQFDLDKQKVFLDNLLTVDPGEKFLGWNIQFKFPRGQISEKLIPKIKDYGFNENKTEQNTLCQELKPNIGYIRIANFFPGIFSNSDSQLIYKFLKKANGRYKKLIIDIRGNDGGEPVFWMDSLIAPLIKKPVSFDQIGAIKNEFIRKLGYKFWIYEISRPGSLSNKEHFYSMEEIKNQRGFSRKQWKVFRITRQIKPKNSVRFDGQIYLLIDKHCFSASDMFASAAKQTKFAKVIGSVTSGGSGSIFPPCFYSLPNSRLLFCLEAELALNPDGTPNSIYGTKPDISLKPDSSNFEFNKETLLNDPWIKWVIKLN